MEIEVSRKALRRFRTVYPQTGAKHLLEELHAPGTVEISESVARPILGRFAENRRWRETTTQFFVDKLRNGMFILVTEPDRQVVVTYIVFAPPQRRFVIAQWPTAVPD